MEGRTFRLVDAASGCVVAARVRLAASAAQRARGLLGRAHLDPGDGIWLAPCNGIHTFGMQFPIDVLVLDRELRVVRMRRAVPAGRFVLPARRGYSTIELPAGTLQRSGLVVGDRVNMDPVSD